MVLDALLHDLDPEAVEVLDEDPDRAGTVCLGILVVRVLDWSELPGRVHVAVGSNDARRRLGERATSLGHDLHTVLHPRASVAAGVSVAGGVFAAAGCVLGPSARLGSGVIVNHGAVVDHECTLGDWVHVAPNATLGGGVRVGSGALIGAGAVILPGISVGRGAVVGAGAVVTRAVPADATVIGVPARANRDP